jgi:hypothetical protein
MWEPIAPLINAIKNAGPVIYAAVLVTTLLLLFLPDWAVSQMGLAEFRAMYRMYIGVVLIASASLLTVYAVPAIAPLIWSPFRTWFNRRADLKRLADLTNAEKAFLRSYIVDGENTRYAPLTDGVASGLQAKTLIYRASRISLPGGNFPFNLQPPIRKLLNERPHLLN